MSLFDLSSVVLQLSTDTVTVRRFDADTYDSQGRANARTSSTFTTRAAVQPIKGRDLARLPEGCNATEYVAVHATVALQLRDRITVPSRGDFEVEHLDNWGLNGNFFKVFARQLDDSEPRT